VRRRRIEIITVRERSFVLRRRVGPVAGWCRRCGAEVRLIAPDEAAVICDISLRTLFRWVEAGEAHCEETADGASRICLSSLVEPAAGTGCELRIGEARGDWR
jgi:hypothetical protein